MQEQKKHFSVCNRVERLNVPEDDARTLLRACGELSLDAARSRFGNEKSWKKKDFFFTIFLVFWPKPPRSKVVCSLMAAAPAQVGSLPAPPPHGCVRMLASDEMLSKHAQVGRMRLVLVCAG